MDEKFETVWQALVDNGTSKQAADLAAFKAQKDTAGGKTTMRSYIWSLESAAYDQEHNG